MKWKYLIGLLLVSFMLGCASPTEEAPADTAADTTPEPAAPVAEAPVEAPVEAAPAEDAADEDASSMIEPEQVDISGLTDLELAQIEDLKSACSKGALGLCTALKTRYGIDMSPGDAIAEEAAEAPVEEAVEEPAEDAAEEQ